MRIHDVKVTSEGRSATLSAMIRPDGAAEPRELWYRFDGLDAPLSENADAVAVATLPFCMFEGEACRIAAPISPVLERNLSEAQRVLSDWYEFLVPVAVEPTAGAPSASPAGAATPTRAPGIASCFSGGVDSWFTLLDHMPRISHLLLIRGFDIGLANETLWRSTRADAETVAAALGKSLVTCETNLRSLLDKGRSPWGRPFPGDFWGRCLHGAALASTALALQETIGEVIVPATHSWSQVKPWGSSPVLDYWWSNGAVTVTHDDCTADRVEKVRAIAGSDIALSTLRVCHNDLGETNCGRCEKCLRTMLALHLAGALGRATRFPGPEALSRLKRMEAPPHLMHHYESLLEAGRREDHREVARLAEIVLGRRLSAERIAALAARRMRRSPPAAWTRAALRQTAPLFRALFQQAADVHAGRH